jgi:hypothetical protein
MKSKLTQDYDMTTLISAYESDDDDDDEHESPAIETGASIICSSTASVITAVTELQGITTTDEPRKKHRCIDAIPPFPPTIKPAANTVENIKYYMDAMKRHDFRLIDVRRLACHARNACVLLP